MATFVPLIGSDVAGPLGVVHLPRLWQKLSLGATDQLHPDWDLCGKGFDQMVLDGLGIGRDNVIAYVRENCPTYAQFEAWVRQNAAPGKLSPENIKRLNDSIRAYEHDDATRKSILAEAGISDDGSIRDAVRLNALEDWTAFHKAVIAR